MEIVEIQKAVQNITNYVNSYSLDSDKFNEIMGCEHRTLQQSFTRLCLKWLEYAASDEYRFDDRNQASHQIGEELINLYKDANGETWLPSKSLPLI